MESVKKLLLFFLLLLPSKILANSIDDIKMDIYIDNNGTAHVTEVWNAESTYGTELYKPYYNLGRSKITNFKASMNGTNFIYNDNWNTKGEFDEKAYHNGINYIKGGLELCLGISKYGNNTYTFSYDISDFVMGTTDGYQMVYWNLFPYDFEPNPKRVYIKIHSDFDYNNTKLWCYGKYGMPCKINNGYIEIDSVKQVKSKNYITVLIQYPNNTFSTNSHLSNSFDYYYKMSKKNSFSYINFKKILTIGGIILLTLIYTYMIKDIIIGLIHQSKKDNNKLSYRRRFVGDKPNFKNVGYYRDIDKLDIFDLYFISGNYNIIDNEAPLFEAILLKWIKEKKISINKNKEIHFLNKNNIDSREEELYDMLYRFSNNDILSYKEFKSHVKNNYNEFIHYFEKIFNTERKKFHDSGYIFDEDYDNYVIGPKLNEEAKKIFGLKNFIEDFSNLNKKEMSEVKLWDDYLIYAALLGINSNYVKKLIKINNNYMDSDFFDNMLFAREISSSGVSISERQSRIDNAKASESDRSSIGGGGFSSGGGGGGSFGGGGGGGGIR